MRFSADKCENDLVCATFMKALPDSVYHGLRHLHLARSQTQQWAEPILSEVHDILAGITFVAGRTGVVQVVLMLATDSKGQEGILGGGGSIQFVIDETSFDYAQMALLCQLVEVVEGLVADLDLPLEKTIEIVTDIVWGICCNVDGSTIINTPHGRILPILGFGEGLGEMRTVTTSGGESWMHEYVHSVVDEYFGR
jgi:hypothetical protein